jgi:predicted CopG family antitoxin
MSEEENIKLTIEKLSYAEVIRQFTIHNCDIRMEVTMNAFLSDIEEKIKEIDRKLNGT